MYDTILIAMNKARAGIRPTPYRYTAIPANNPIGNEVRAPICDVEKFFKGNKMCV